jgi:hypothetical protein
MNEVIAQKVASWLAGNYDENTKKAILQLKENDQNEF